MASQRTSSGYNNPAYSSQYDYDQLARYSCPGTRNHRNNTYIAFTAVDNCCYKEDEELELSSSVIRQQAGNLVREPPIGASTTFKITETCADNMSPRTVTTPASPKRNHPKVTRTAHPRSAHGEEATGTPPRTPTKNVSVIVTSTPRKPRASESPRRAVTLSPRMRVRNTATEPPLTSPIRPAVRAVKNASAHQASAQPRHNMAVIPPTYTSVSTALPRDRQPFLATGLVCRKSPARMDTSPAIKASWIHIPTPYQTPPTKAIAAAVCNLLMFGALTLVLSMCIMSKEGRRYYLDFAVLSGFGYVLLGCLGIRSRKWQWLPNRNYVSGYIVLSVFSFLTWAGLCTIIALKPKPGEPLADLVGGAVCGIAVLSFILAAFGVLSSSCCENPPPDNRVVHCAEGFTL